jgi:excisionase family DNA binding protein
MTLAEACGLLSVNQSTLRQWADEGRVRAFRTPGGHRRFRREDLDALLGQSTERRGPHNAVPTLEESALRRIRRRIHGEQAAHEQPWMERLTPDGRLRLRLFGRRLLDLSVAYITQRRRRPAILEEVQGIGGEYGQYLARVAMPLGEVLEAFIFFRNTLFDAVRDATAHGPLHGADMANVWAHMEHLADLLLLSMIRSYERSVHADAPAATR